jgi:hypothetical protein
MKDKTYQTTFGRFRSLDLPIAEGQLKDKALKNILLFLN